MLTIDILQALADIIGAIVTFLKPVVAPIGQFMIYWIDFTLSFFPTGSWILYFILFGILIVAGIVVNSYWPGDQPIEKPPKKEKEAKLEEPKIEEETIDFDAPVDKEEKEKEEKPKSKPSENDNSDSENKEKTPVM